MPKTIILGGGIHGVSIAYYLATKFQIKTTIVEQTRIAAAASGKSGGFLARGWGYGPTVQLHEKSYDLHKELATTLQLETYREIPTLSVDGNRKGKNIASWLNKKVSSRIMDTNTAQVTSSELTEKMLQVAIDSVGTEVMIDTAINIIQDPTTQQIQGVLLQSGQILEAEHLIIAMGPWSTVAVEDWFHLPLPMEGIKSSSIIFQNLAPILEEPYACFCEDDSQGCHLELYPRSNGDLYICGIGGSDHVTIDRLRSTGDCASASMIESNPQRIQKALQSLSSMSSIFQMDQLPNISQACMRPCTSDALPVMGCIPNIPGAYISTGHNCWGILWAPISGLAMAELIATGTCSVIDLSAFDPSRFLPDTSQSLSQRGKKVGTTNVGEQW
jgi:glycine/D-amino acid oxidase-like deaminating enzyme